MVTKNPISDYLKTQYHPTKNDKPVESYTAGSKKHVWWKCEKNHEWEAQIGARTRGNNCPYCSGRRITPGVNDLLTINPKIASQWHPTKNGTLLPSQVAPTTTKKVWWQAEDGHEWEAKIVHRSKSSNNCAVCLGSAIQVGVNDLASQRPDLLPYIHPTRNKNLDPQKTAKTSHEVIWWQCDQKHEWEQSIESFKNCPICTGRKLVPGINDLLTLHPRLGEEWVDSKNKTPAHETTLSTGLSIPRTWKCKAGHEWVIPLRDRLAGRECYYCSHERLLPGFNDLKTMHPDLADEWHPELNDETPDSILFKTHMTAWWRCNQGHSWAGRVVRRTQKGSGCTVCSGSIIIPGINDLITTNPAYKTQWNFEKNKGLDPHSMSPGSAYKVWWKCEKNHEWEVSPSTRTSNNSGCPYCSNKKFKSGYNDVLTLHPQLAKQWHPTKNTVTPSEIISGSTQKVWWKCDNGHEWDMSVSDRTYAGMNCPLCSGRRVVTGINDFATIRPDLLEQWDYKKNTVDPTTISPQSNKKVWWACGEPGHEWKSSVQNRSGMGRGCPFCQNKQVLEGYNDLATTRPHLIQEWHSELNGELTPSMMTYGSKKKVWWKCNKGHEWEAMIADRSRGIGCRRCTTKDSKGEIELAEFIESLGVTVIKNSRSLMRNNKEIDIFVPEKNLGIEYNGVYWHSTAFTSDKNVHYDKWKACQDKGIQLITVWEDDWMDNPEVVKSLITHKLGKSTNKKIYARKTRVVDVSLQDAEDFLNENHIQGFAGSSTYYGLQHENEIVSLLALRLEKERTIGNIVRYATSAVVSGGFSKLLSHVEKTLNLDSLYTFSDNSVSDGGLYDSLGFTAVKNIAPNYMYLVNSKRIHKFNYRIERFRKDPNLKFKEGMTEKELAELNNLHRIYDAGKIKWEKTLKR